MREHITRRRVIGGLGAIVVLGAVGGDSEDSNGSGGAMTTTTESRADNDGAVGDDGDGEESEYENPQAFTVEARADGDGILQQDGSTWFEPSEYGYYYGDYDAGVDGTVTNISGQTLQRVSVGVEFISTENVVVHQGTDYIASMADGQTHRFDVPLLEFDYEGDMWKFTMKISA